MNKLLSSKPIRCRLYLFILVLVLLTLFNLNNLTKKEAHTTQVSELMGQNGYTTEFLNAIEKAHISRKLETRTIDDLVKKLPLQANRKFISYTINNNNHEIEIVYAIEETPILKGNGLDPFPDTINENNALILFYAINDLKKVSYKHFDDLTLHTLDHSDQYDLNTLENRFASLDLSKMQISTLSNILASNFQLSGSYFTHYSRLSFKSGTDEVSYRLGDAPKIEKAADGALVWNYPDVHERYYFNTKMELTRTLTEDGSDQTYNEVVSFLGVPSIEENMEDDAKYIAYALREGEDRWAYFIVQKDNIIASGIMYGNDYHTLELEGSNSLLSVIKKGQTP